LSKEIVLSEEQKKELNDLLVKGRQKEHEILAVSYQKLTQELQGNDKSTQDNQLLFFKSVLLDSGVKTTTDEMNMWNYDGKTFTLTRKDDPEPEKKEKK